MKEPTQVLRSKRLSRIRNLVFLFVLLSSINYVFAATGAEKESSAPAQSLTQGAPLTEGQGPATGPAPSQPPAGASPSVPDSSVVKNVREALLKDPFTYTPKNLVDPFIAFIAPADTAPPVVSTEDDDMVPPLEPQRPLTPLQKMKISEVEKGLKAITWGDLGRKAIIEDAAGKGYIVGVGTPVGEKNGVVTEIFNDHLVIQQESWDKKAKRMIPQNFVVKLVKVKSK